MDQPSQPSPSSAAVLPSLGAVWRFPPVRRLFVCNLALFAGISLQATALAKQAYDMTGRELDIGLIGLAEFLPAFLLVLVTGSVADRFPRKIVALFAVGGELVSSVALLLYALSGPTEVWPLFLIAFGYGIARAFQAPAMRAMPPMVSPEGALPRVYALFSSTWTTAVIIGPALSGFLYAVDPWVAYVGSTTLILFGWLSLFRLRFVRQPVPPDPDEKMTLHNALEGLRFIRRTPILLGAVSLDLFAVLFGGAIALLPVIAEERLGVGDVGYGWLRAAPGIGAAAMALWIATRPITRHVGSTLFAVVAIFGAGTVVLGITRDYVVAFAVLVIISAADMVSVYIRGTLVPLVTPDEKRGRVLAMENVFIGASNELGAFESGVAGQTLGTPVTVIGGGVGTLVCVGIWAVAFPALRKIDRFDDLEFHEIRDTVPPVPQDDARPEPGSIG